MSPNLIYSSRIIAPNNLTKNHLLWGFNTFFLTVKLTVTIAAHVKFLVFQLLIFAEAFL